MPKICDNKSAAVIIGDGQGNVLLIERMKKPFGIVIPAGHLDGDQPDGGAKREILEEVGLRMLGMGLVFNKTLTNPCKREGGTYHEWYVYASDDWEKVAERSHDETKRIIWASPEQLNSYAKRTEEFADKYKLEPDDLVSLTPLLNDDEDWQKQPGFEPVWYKILKKLKYI